MPPQEMWQGFFDPATVLTKLGLAETCALVVDFGCGYGTFAIPAAKMIRGNVLALDIESEMVATTRQQAIGTSNLQVMERDFIESGSGLPDRSADYVMLFNILHASEAPSLLGEALRILKPGAKLGVMHWNYDPSTPRGPSLDIRLRPEECVRLVESAGFQATEIVDLAPFHYGFSATPS